ncbi:PQQ-binding-like beta-propeller repeat protein [Hoyosella altamirensis]|uniref:Uncharacterized protein n=1 Tax=Hoyosella altamirensis TaxID=616997 RepID=A0A839RHQ9_9ACTN|nr:PQQ-binding-like beta-propeller repeat protein [Hoyosella altamirensis]MBB3035663.1 hypothetical protein [Hoyosella altamirensis]
MIAPERRTRADVVAAVAITVLVIVATFAIWWRSDYRQAQSSPAERPIEAVAGALATPTSVRELWRAPNEASTVPITSGGTVVSTHAGEVTGHDVATGDPRWRYERQRELCAVTGQEHQVVAVYRTPRGCTQVTALESATGVRGEQRTSDADASVMLSSDGPHVMSQGPQRLEVWRSDLVRTLEFGRVAAPVNPDRQQRAGCDILDAHLTRSRVAAILQCPDESGERLVLLDSTPERNNEPEEHGSTLLTTQDSALGEIPGAHGTSLAAVSAQLTAIFVPGDADEIAVYGQEGTAIHRWALTDVPTAPGISDDAPIGFSPERMSTGTVSAPMDMAYWFTGTDVVSLSGRDFRPLWRVPASGLPATMAGQLLIPTPAGISVHNARTGALERTIALDRNGDNVTGLAVLGDFILEQRNGDAGTVVVLGQRTSARPRGTS